MAGSGLEKGFADARQEFAEKRMNAPADIIATDFAASDRFDKRMRNVLKIGLVLSLPLFLFQLTIAPEFSLLMHSACALLAAAMVALHRDGWRAFFYSSPYWTFSFMLLVNASGRAVSIDYNILDPDRAAAIVLVSQFGVAVVGLIDALVQNQPRQASAAAVERTNNLVFTLLVSSIIVLALRFTGGISPIVAKSFFYLLPDSGDDQFPATGRASKRSLFPISVWRLQRTGSDRQQPDGPFVVCTAGCGASDDFRPAFCDLAAPGVGLFLRAIFDSLFCRFYRCSPASGHARSNDKRSAKQTILARDADNAPQSFPYA